MNKCQPKKDNNGVIFITIFTFLNLYDILRKNGDRAMLFLESDFSVKIISVVSLSWTKNNTLVAPRPFNALSFRLSGNAVFKNDGVQAETQDSDMLFMPEGVGYHLRSGAEKIIAIHFELTGKKQNCFEVFRPENPERFCELFSSISDTWEEKKSGYILHATSVFYRIL